MWNSAFYHEVIVSQNAISSGYGSPSHNLYTVVGDVNNAYLLANTCPCILRVCLFKDKQKIN